MRPGGYFAKPDLIPLDEEFHAEQPEAPEGLRDRGGVGLCLFQGSRGHGLGLPGLPVIAVHLHMANGIAKQRSIPVANRQQSDFVVEVDEALDDDALPRTPGAFAGVAPSGGGVLGPLQRGLPFP